MLFIPDNSILVTLMVKKICFLVSLRDCDALQNHSVKTTHTGNSEHVVLCSDFNVKQGTPSLPLPIKT